MILGIDHLVLPTTKADVDGLAGRLLEAGLTRIGDGDSGDHGTSNTLLAFQDGGFLELAWEHEPGSAPFPGLFGVTPRIAGLGFTSNEFDQDRQRFAAEPQAWLWEREWTRSDGVELGYRAAGPIPVGEAYLFLMEGTSLPNEDSESHGRLTEIRLSGTPADEWRQRYAASLPVSLAGDRFTVGHTNVVFQPDAQSPLTATITIEGAQTSATIPLAQGSIELRH